MPATARSEANAVPAPRPHEGDRTPRGLRTPVRSPPPVWRGTGALPAGCSHHPLVQQPCHNDDTFYTNAVKNPLQRARPTSRGATSPSLGNRPLPSPGLDARSGKPGSASEEVHIQTEPQHLVSPRMLRRTAKAAGPPPATEAMRDPGCGLRRMSLIKSTLGPPRKASPAGRRDASRQASSVSYVH